MHPLTTLINIGKKLAADLQQIGIGSAEDFLRRDPYEVFHLLHLRYPTICRCYLASIVGASQGVKWHILHASAAKEYEKRYPSMQRKTAWKGC